MGHHTWLTPYIWHTSSVLSSGVGLLPFAMTKMFFAGKILIAAASVGPMMLADLYYGRLGCCLGVLMRTISRALTQGINSAVLVVSEVCVA